MTESVNMSVLYINLFLKNYRNNDAIIDYFVERHPTYAPALRIYKNMCHRKQVTDMYDSIAEVTAQIPHDIEYVERNSKFLSRISRQDTSYASPAIIPTPSIIVPAYAIRTAAGGAYFTPFVTNNLTIAEDEENAYYARTPVVTLPNRALQLLQALQAATVAGNNDYVTIAQQYAADFLNDANVLLTRINDYKTRIIAFTSFQAQLKAAHLTKLDTRKYVYDDYEE